MTPEVAPSAEWKENSMYDLQPINALLCFVVARESGDLVWFSERQIWWPIDVARNFVLRGSPSTA